MHYEGRNERISSLLFGSLDADLVEIKHEKNGGGPPSRTYLAIDYPYVLSHEVNAALRWVDFPMLQSI